jgi:hypothetical protein
MSGSLYCCSLFDSSGYYSCSYFSSCIFDNSSCGAFNTITWVAGSLLVLGLILMIVSACQFKKAKQFALMNYQNMQVQNYGNQPNGYNQPNAYNQPNQNYVPPPQYYRQN